MSGKPLRWITLVLVIAVAVGGLLTAPSPDRILVEKQLDVLKTLNDPDGAQFIDHHPEVVAELLNSKSKEFGKWWESLSKRDRGKIMRTAPQLVGNLGGIDYATRDRANRTYLKRQLAAAKKRIASHPGDAQAKTDLQAFDAIKGSLRSKKSGPRRYLIALTPNHPPLAAVAVGDLDTAQQITFNVPGMGTYTTDMQLWTQAAQNVFDEQGRIGGLRKRAVVAWIGYITPPPGIDAAFGDYARRGAPQLTGTIKALRAERADEPPKYVNVVAHSYGTTTAADALASTDLNIYSFVMLGSAGIEDSIISANALHAKYVYAGEATADAKAHWGRVTRRDPLSPLFGAWAIAVGENVKAGLAAVTGHEPVLHSAWNDNVLSSAWTRIKNAKKRAAEFKKHQQTFGYLDAGTQSLQNVAIATTPHPIHDVTYRQ